jgi:hypothetical protein
MDRIRLLCRDPARDRAAPGDRQADAGIGRQGYTAQALRAEEADRCAKPRHDARDLAKSLHYAVDLRAPGVGGDEDAHQAARASATPSVSLAAAVVAVQVMISKRPSACSAIAVQLSTQSPQLI